MQNRTIRWITYGLVVGVWMLSSLPGQAQMLKRNLAELAELSERILVGRVVNVTDGLDANNIPYTEVTLAVDEALRGHAAQQHTFRQFGLLAPRDMGNGYTNLNVSPDGWPRFAEGEEVIVFLYKEAPLTGLSTTVGLFQGKFNIHNQQVTNAINNLGLMDNVNVPLSGLSDEEGKLLLMRQGAMPSGAFLSLLRKGIGNGWF